jgi:hypothetical protein
LLEENDMLGTLLIVLVVLAFIHVLRTGLSPVNGSIDPCRALSVLVAVLLILAFAIGFVEWD